MKKSTVRVKWAKPRRILRLLVLAGLISGLVGCADKVGKGGDKTEEKDGTPVGLASDLSPADGAAIYAAAAPSVPKVVTAAGAGAGLLIEGGYVLTAADLVSGGGAVVVSLSDGTIATGVRVAAIDVSANMAMLGPIVTEITPSGLADPKSVATGTELFVLGYGVGQESPSIGRALLSSTLSWELGQLTFLQLDDPGIRLIGPRVVFDRSGKALALQTQAPGGSLAVAAAVLVSRGRALLEDKIAPNRVLGSGEAKAVVKLQLDAVKSQQLIAFDAQVGGPTTLVLKGDAAVAVTVLDAAGTQLEKAQSVAGQPFTLTMAKGNGGRRFAVVELVDPGQVDPGTTATPATAKTTSIEVSADVNLMVFNDPDDGAVLKPGASFVGAMDFPGDRDLVMLDLVAGQSAVVRASSARFDPLVELRALGGDPALTDDDSGGGPFANDALLELKAATPGRHVFVISDALLAAAGGYSVSVSAVASDTQLQETINQIEGLARSVATDPRGEEALRKLLSALVPVPSVKLPAAFGTAWRGSSQADLLVTEVATTDSTSGEGSARTINDADGRFTVRATILARGQSSVALVVTSKGGAQVASGGAGRLNASCPSTLSCVASITTEVVDAAGLGPWTVSLSSASGQIDEWQVEVLGTAETAQTPALPPGQ